jgi:hypothetical protein
MAQGKSRQPAKPSRARSEGGRPGNATPLPSRVAKRRAIERIQRDTIEVKNGSLLTTLRRQGYEELPLDEIQDRLSKLKNALAELIVSRRG